MSVCGGLNNAKPATEEVQSLVDKVCISKMNDLSYPHINILVFKGQRRYSCSSWKTVPSIEGS